MIALKTFGRSPLLKCVIAISGDDNLLAYSRFIVSSNGISKILILP